MLCYIKKPSLPFRELEKNNRDKSQPIFAKEVYSIYNLHACNAMNYNALQHNSMRRDAMQFNTTQCNTIRVPSH